MTHDVTVGKRRDERFYGVLYVMAGALFIWNVYQLHQMNEQRNEVVRWLETEMSVPSQADLVAGDGMPANVCRQLLPVHLWNRNPEDVPVPPRRQRRVV